MYLFSWLFLSKYDGVYQRDSENYPFLFDILNVENYGFYGLICIMKIIDAHSHINYISCDLQPDVVGVICCANNQNDWTKLIDITHDNNNVYGAFGIHPWTVQDVTHRFESELRDLLKTNNRFMIGEIGLDKYMPNMDKQIEVFEKQLRIAVDFNRPVFLHCVGAWDKILHIFKSYRNLPLVIAHSFNDSVQILNNLVQNYNVMFSYHKIDKSHDFNRIQQTPVDKILVESDAKDDVLLKDIVDIIANIKNQPKMADIIYENTKKVLQTWTDYKE